MPGENAVSCEYDCFCGDGHCDPQYENWLNCSLDCTEPSCGNGVCECTRDGQWGSELCCFDDYYASTEDAVRMYQSDWVDDVPPNYIPGCEASSSDTSGPETQESCPLRLWRALPALLRQSRV